MKRFHLHVGVKDLEKSVQFYSTLFGQKPTKLKSDYAKRMLEDPRINFAVSTRTQEEGVDHSGIAWEAYRTMGDAEIFSSRKSDQESGSCCVSDEQEASCCD